MLRYLLIVGVILQVLSDGVMTVTKCDMILSESIPEDLTYENTAMTTVPIWKVWADLIMSSNRTIKITSYYWTLLNNDLNITKYFPSSKTGQMIFDLLDARSKNVSLEVVQNYGEEQNDLRILQKNALVKVHYIDFSRLLNRGIQHSKVWIGDDSRAFIGSANMDWRSLTQVKELGVYIPDCPSIVADVDKFWQALRLLSGPNSTIPAQWPRSLYPTYNHTHPLIVTANGVLMSIYIAASPPAFNPPQRTDDLTAILSTIGRAQRYVCISVMDMFPLQLGYGRHNDSFWPLIENELKKAAIERKVAIKLLISWWRHSQDRMLDYLRSLKSLSKIKGVNIDVKIFVVPAFTEEEREIPFSRVSHSKYMVTESTAYVGTSNWSGDYFDYTGGLSLVAEELDPDTYDANSVKSQLKAVFDTDWYSMYAHDLW